MPSQESSPDLPLSHLAIMRALAIIIQNQVFIMKAMPQQTVATVGHSELYERIRALEEWIRINQIEGDL